MTVLLRRISPRIRIPEYRSLSPIIIYTLRNYSELLLHVSILQLWAHEQERRVKSRNQQLGRKWIQRKKKNVWIWLHFHYAKRSQQHSSYQDEQSSFSKTFNNTSSHSLNGFYGYLNVHAFQDSSAANANLMQIKYNRRRQ